MSQSANLQIASMHDWHWCGYAVTCRLNTRLSEMQRLRLPLRLPAMAQRLPRLWRRSPLSANVCTPLPQRPLTLRHPLTAALLWPMPTHRLSQVTTHCECLTYRSSKGLRGRICMCLTLDCSCIHLQPLCPSHSSQAHPRASSAYLRSAVMLDEYSP